MNITQDATHVPGVSPLEQRAFRDTLGHYGSGVTIISAHNGAEPIGFTCQSFYSVSVEPPLISFSVMRSSTTYPRIRETGSFVVNVLAAGQQDVSNQFARKGTDKWAGVAWNPTRRGTPVLDGSLMWLDCDIVNEIEAGDHYIVVGHVSEMSAPDWHGDDPLLFFKGSYRQLAA